MNIKTRKLLRNLVRQNPELLTVDPQDILDNHKNNKPLHVPVFLVEPETTSEIIQEVVPSETGKINLESLDWNSILELAKTNNITNYRKMKKSDLISQLLELQNDGRLS